MSTHVEVLHIPIVGEAAEAVQKSAVEAQRPAQRPLDLFTTEQIRSLVHQVFFPPSGKLRRQIVFSSVDEDVDVGGICNLIGETLSERVNETVGVVDAHACSRDLAVNLNRRKEMERAEMAELRAKSNQISGNLWVVPGPIFWGNDAHAGSPAWVRSRLEEIRGEFGYSIVHAPAAGIYSGTCLLAQASDGLVLIIEAEYTRRSTAQKTKEMLYAANVKLLGTILSGRTFPIPERIYRKL
jgi:hypothetical protein